MGCVCWSCSWLYNIHPNIGWYPNRYINSVSWKQVHGENQTASQLSACNPLLYVYNDPATNQRVANSSFPSEGMITPCGLWPWSYFNDTYTFRVGANTIPVDVRDDEKHGVVLHAHCCAFCHIFVCTRPSPNRQATLRGHGRSTSSLAMCHP